MAKKGKKGKGDKLPKTIAGVAVPKELRSAGGLLARIMRDPGTREVALAALTAALAVRKDNRKAVRKAVVGGTSDAAEQAGRAAGWVKPALTAAAIEAGRMLIDAFDDGKKRDKTAPPPEEAQAKPALTDKREGGAPGVTH